VKFLLKLYHRSRGAAAQRSASEENLPHIGLWAEEFPLFAHLAFLGGTNLPPHRKAYWEENLLEYSPPLDLMRSSFIEVLIGDQQFICIKDSTRARQEKYSLLSTVNPARAGRRESYW
jgi:hypothetical protein